MQPYLFKTFVGFKLETNTSAPSFASFIAQTGQTTGLISLLYLFVLQQGFKSLPERSKCYHMGECFPSLQQRQEILASSFHVFFWGEGLSTAVQGFSGWSAILYYIMLYPIPPLPSRYLPVPQTSTAFSEDTETWGKMGERKL